MNSEHSAQTHKKTGLTICYSLSEGADRCSLQQHTHTCLLFARSRHVHEDRLLLPWCCRCCCCADFNPKKKKFFFAVGVLLVVSPVRLSLLNATSEHGRPPADFCFFVVLADADEGEGSLSMQELLNVGVVVVGVIVDVDVDVNVDNFHTSEEIRCSTRRARTGTITRRTATG